MEGKNIELGLPQEMVCKKYQSEPLVKTVKESGIHKMIRENFAAMERFIGCYSEDKVIGDMKKVVEIENGFFEKNNLEDKNRMGEKEGDDLEYLIEEKAELNNWFGENSFISRTLIYDDLVNGVDMILEYDDDGESKQIALIIDASSSKDQSKLERKISRNIMTVKTGNRSLDYFESQVDGTMGKIDGIIPVVIGVDSTHVQDMIDNEKDSKYFKDHPVQIAFLNEIKTQLDYYSKVCPRNNESSVKRFNQINVLKKIIDGVLDEKEVLAGNKTTREYLNKDSSYSIITGRFNL